MNFYFLAAQNPNNNNNNSTRAVDTTANNFKHCVEFIASA